MTAIRVLHLEDDPVDAELTAATFEADGLDVSIERVEAETPFRAALRRGTLDVILADFNLPQFDGLAAQRIAAEICPDVPFIFLSGTLGEEVAVERLKAGATDYVLKQRIARLPSSVRRALQEAEDRRARVRAEEDLRRLNIDLERRVREATSFLEDLVASSPSMVFRLHPSDARIIYASPNVGWILGYDADEVTRPGFWPSVLHDEDRDQAIQEMRAAKANNVVQVEQEYRVRSKDGRHRWFFVLTRVDYAADGTPLTILRYCLDISDRKAADELVRAARHQAERANRAKSEFVSRMSHDLRTPLNALLGFAQLLAMDDLTPDQRESVQLILRGGEHLLQLINEVLEISRIEAGHLSLSPEPVDVCEIVAHAVELIAPLAADRRIAVNVDHGSAAQCAVLADRQRLNQLLLNLLSNAVKYNRQGGRITIDFERMPGERLRIRVSDTGAGIPPEKLTLLFKPFERLGAEMTAVEGTGLGLAFSRGLAQAMGGAMGVTSVVDEGSTFWVELAVTNRAEIRPEPEGTASAATDPANVRGTLLYIEDNTSNVRLMQRLVQRRPHVTLRHAASGELGIHAATEQVPGLILLDLHLPDMHGEEVLRRLHENPALRDIPVAVLSADATPEQARRLRAAGATTYLTKPLNVPTVLHVIDRALTPRASDAAVMTSQERR